jgi:hypothetical protein
VKQYPLCNRLALVVLAALLALPLAQSDSPVEAKKRSRANSKAFANPALIYLPEYDSIYPAEATRYPATIEVRGLKGAIRDVNLRLEELIHAYPDDVNVLLVGPGGQTAHVMANAGGSSDAIEVSLRLDDEAAAALPNETPLGSGTFRPIAHPGANKNFNEPAPPAGGNSALSVFDGTNPNGTWRLFVQDEDAPTQPGLFADGWALEITTTAKAKKKR